MVVQPSRLRKVSYAWVRNPAADWLLAIALPAIWATGSLVTGSSILLTETAPDVRRVVFQSLVALSGTFAGFVLTSVTILVNLLRTPVSSLDRLLSASDKRHIGEVLLSVLTRLALVFISALIALIIDSTCPRGVWWIEGPVIASLVAALSSIMRVIWVLRRLLAVTESGAG